MTTAPAFISFSQRGVVLNEVSEVGHTGRTGPRAEANNTDDWGQTDYMCGAKSRCGINISNQSLASQKLALPLKLVYKSKTAKMQSQMKSVIFVGVRSSIRSVLTSWLKTAVTPQTVADGVVNISRCEIKTANK